jgi:hypothetical protein
MFKGLEEGLEECNCARAMGRSATTTAQITNLAKFALPDPCRPQVTDRFFFLFGRGFFLLLCGDRTSKGIFWKSWLLRPLRL